MKLKILIMMLFCATITGSEAEEKEPFRLSSRIQPSNEVSEVTFGSEAFTPLLRPLTGLLPAQLPETIASYKEHWQTLSADEGNEKGRFDLFCAVNVLTFGGHPERVLSVLWPLFLIAFLIWFIRQFIKVFVQRMKI